MNPIDTDPLVVVEDQERPLIWIDGRVAPYQQWSGPRWPDGYPIWDEVAPVESVTSDTTDLPRLVLTAALLGLAFGTGVILGFGVGASLAGLWS